jgi:transposase
MDKRFLEDCLAKGMSLPQIGRLVGRSPGTVGYWVKKHGLTANGASRFAPRDGIVEEVLEIAVDQGMTLGELAEELELDISTVRYWLKKYGLPTDSGWCRRSRKLADPVGTRKEMDCRRHGLTGFVMEGRGYYRCMKCRSENVSAWRRRMKRLLVEEAGGECRLCGYDRCVAALEFHHLDPRQKSFPLSMRGVTCGIDKLRTEAAKCVLLCATCHAEVEAGDVDLPLKLTATAGDPR